MINELAHTHDCTAEEAGVTLQCLTLIEVQQEQSSLSKAIVADLMLKS